MASTRSGSLTTRGAGQPAQEGRESLEAVEAARLEALQVGAAREAAAGVDVRRHDRAQRRAEAGDEPVPAVQGLDERRDAPPAMEVAVVGDAHAEAQLTGAVEQRDETQVAPEEVVQAVVRRELRLAAVGRVEDSDLDDAQVSWTGAAVVVTGLDRRTPRRLRFDLPR
ncbi:MAG: hypothetical protein KIT58_17875 [Planctomycetota bacterium]|nr:hypothetical protein [Planctomycetota bacterium]